MSGPEPSETQWTSAADPDVIPLRPVDRAGAAPPMPPPSGTAGSAPAEPCGAAFSGLNEAPPAPLAGWFLALLVCTGVMAFYHLAGGAHFEPIDCWVGQTAREMSESGDYLVPRFAGETRMQKSPGPYWTVIGVSRLLDVPVNEVTTRIPNGIAALLLVAVIFWLAREISGARTAVFAGFAAAGSVLILHWSHRGASDLGLTAFMTLSLAAFWIAANSSCRRKRATLTLLAWFAAGLGMIYKMPMPLVCVGLPMFFYVLLCRRWSYLANAWHLPGLLLFAAPWLPWAVAVALAEPIALDKWRVEYLDRFTGDLPNVEEQQANWRFYLLYLAPPLLYCLPFSLSLPGALARAFREVFSPSSRTTLRGVDRSNDPAPPPDGAGQPAVAALTARRTLLRDGLAFLLIWFFSHFVFFTLAVGKELRYLLPALPPLFVLLGLELSAFFHPRRPVSPWRDRLGLWMVWLLLPAILAGGVLALRRWHREYNIEPWELVLTAYLVTAGILALGMGLAAWLYVRRREHASFAAVVATMWAMWLWAWPNLLPMIQTQRPMIDLAEQVRQFWDSGLPEARTPMYHVGSQDSRIIWYGDLRPLPRVIDQLELLKLQGGQRSLSREIELIADEMIRKLRDPSPVLFMATRFDYILFRSEAPRELAARGESMPPVHLWFQARLGPKSRQYLVFGNRPPPWPEPELSPPSERLAVVAAPAPGAPGAPGSPASRPSTPASPAKPASAPAAQQPDEPPGHPT